MKKLNIAEMLKDCPSGMELDCTMFENLKFDRIVDSPFLPIRCRILHPDGNRYNIYNFTKHGCYADLESAKCVIFPKGKTTWEGFQRPFKDGDIAISYKGDIHLLKTANSSYCAYRERWEGLDKFDKTITTGVSIVRFATEEEKQKLFDAIKANGYKWNAVTKTLEKLIVPKFKVGDKVQWYGTKDYRPIRTIKSIEYDRYILDNNHYINFGDEHAYKVLKFDITTLKPFDKVLVRDTNSTHFWEPKFFFRYEPEKQYPFRMLNYQCFNMCIPYKGNEHLIGTTNDCDEYYKTWE